MNTKNARYALLGSVVITLALYFIPFGRTLAYPLLLLSTLAHEMGHGLTALAVGGNFSSFSMWSDGSGLATISSSGTRIDQALIAAGGLVGPSIAASLCFAISRSSVLSRIFLLTLGVLLIIAEFMLVRNFFTIIYLAVLASIFLLIAQSRIEWLASTSLVFIATQLSLSVFSRSDYLFTKYAQTGAGSSASDVQVIAEALILPYWFWGALCGLFSVIVLSAGMWFYMRRS